MIDLGFFNRKKNIPKNLRIDEYTQNVLAELCANTNQSESEIMRRAIYFMRILFDPELKMKQIVEKQDWNKSLSEIITPLPLLARKILEIDLKFSNRAKKDQIE